MAVRAASCCSPPACSWATTRSSASTSPRLAGAWARRARASAPASPTTHGARRAARRRPQEHGFPLFEVPYELPFIALTEKAFTHLVNEHYAVLQRALSAHERLERIVLSERGLDGVAAALASLIGGPALIFDARGEVLGPRAAPGALCATRTVAALARRAARAHPPPGARRGYAPGGRASSRRPARSRCRSPRTPPSGDGDGPPPDAWLVAAKDAGAADRVRPAHAPPGRHDRGARAAAPARGRRHRAPAGRRRADRAGVRRPRRRRAGAPAGAVRARRRASACSCSRRRAAAQGRRRGGARPTAVRDEARGGLVAGTGAFSCALLPRGRGDDELFALAERVRARVARETGESCRPAPAGRSRRRPAARASTRRAARSRRGRWPQRPTAAARRLATYRDLGSFQLLLSLQDDDALRLFCDSILAPIEDGEGAYGGELMRSLEAFIECNGQWERAARAALLPPSHAALPDPPRRGAHRAARWTPRATASTSGSRCAGRELHPA